MTLAKLFSNPTPRPWRVETKDLDPHEQQYEGRVRVCSGNEDGEGGGNGGIYVAHTLGPDRVANSRAIAHAVNHFDALVEALEEAASALERAATCFRDGSVQNAAMQSEAADVRAALNAAKGEPS